MDKTWILRYTSRAIDDFQSLDKTQRRQVQTAIEKVLQNPLPQSEGGYGKPLRGRLAGCFKIKLLDAGIRILYVIKREQDQMVIILIGMRRDVKFYELAVDRLRAFRSEN